MLRFTNRFSNEFDGTIVLSMRRLEQVGLSISEIRTNKFWHPEINTHDIALLLVRFGQFLLIVFPLLKWYHLVQNGRFSGQT